MMKTKKIIIIIFILSLISLVFTGCGGIPVTPDNEEVDQEYIVEEEYFNVNASQGGIFSLSDGTEVKIDPGDLSDDAYLILKKIDINYDLELSKQPYLKEPSFILVDIICDDLLSPAELYMATLNFEFLGEEITGGIIRFKDDTFELIKEFTISEGEKVQVSIEEIGKAAYLFVINPVNDVIIINDLVEDINLAVQYYYDENCTSLYSLYQQALQEEEIAGENLENYPGITKEDAEEIFAEVNSWGTIIDLGIDLINELAPTPVTAAYAIYSAFIKMGEICQYYNAYMIAKIKTDIYSSKILKRRVIKHLYEQGCLGEEDFINIISVTPDSGLIDGVYTDFTVVVEYNLVSCDTGLLMIGFNNGDEIGRYYMISNASHIVNKGSGKYTFNVNALTKNWGTQGDFSVYVNISEYPHPSPWTPLDTDTYALTFY